MREARIKAGCLLLRGGIWLTANIAALLRWAPPLAAGNLAHYLGGSGKKRYLRLPSDIEAEVLREYYGPSPGYPISNSNGGPEEVGWTRDECRVVYTPRLHDVVGIFYAHDPDEEGWIVCRDLYDWHKYPPDGACSLEAKFYLPPWIPERLARLAVDLLNFLSDNSYIKLEGRKLCIVDEFWNVVGGKPFISEFRVKAR